MPQYIDKDALVAEIERLQAITMDEDGNFYTAKAQAEYNVLCMLESFLDTIEVKDSLELTVEDIKMLDALLIKMWNDKSDNKYEEVLKQFKVQKGSKL